MQRASSAVVLASNLDHECCRSHSQASATRAVLNGGIRLGLYDPIKTLMSADGSGRDLHMGQKLAAGSISGGIGAVLTTPIELAKTRLQVLVERQHKPQVNLRLLCKHVRRQTFVLL